MNQQQTPDDILRALGMDRAARRKIEALMRRDKRADTRTKLRKAADAAIAATRPAAEEK